MLSEYFTLSSLALPIINLIFTPIKEAVLFRHGGTSGSKLLATKQALYESASSRFDDHVNRPEDSRAG